MLLIRQTLSQIQTSPVPVSTTTSNQSHPAQPKDTGLHDPKHSKPDSKSHSPSTKAPERGHTQSPPRDATAAPVGPTAFAHPPGQTVDDLLNSILGVSAFPPRPTSPTANFQPTPDAHVTTQPNRTTTPSHPAPPDSLHAGVASPFPTVGSPFPRVHQQHRQSPLHNSATPTIPPSQPGYPTPVQNQMNGQVPINGPIDPNAHLNGFMPPAPLDLPPNMPPFGVDPGIAAREAISGLMACGPDARERGKEAFVNNVLNLLTVCLRLLLQGHQTFRKEVLMYAEPTSIR